MTARAGAYRPGFSPVPSHEFAPLSLRSTRSTHRFMAHDAAYGENHAFAVAFTCVAAASQGLGGLLAVLGMGESLC